MEEFEDIFWVKKSSSFELRPFIHTKDACENPNICWKSTRCRRVCATRFRVARRSSWDIWHWKSSMSNLSTGLPVACLFLLHPQFDGNWKDDKEFIDPISYFGRKVEEIYSYCSSCESRVTLVLWDVKFDNKRLEPPSSVENAGWWESMSIPWNSEAIVRNWFHHASILIWTTSNSFDNSTYLQVSVMSDQPIPLVRARDLGLVGKREKCHILKLV